MSRPGRGPATPDLDFDRFEWVSFDCYGTLVDWETGISTAVAEVLEAHGIRKSRAEILALFADAEPRVQDSGYLEYRTVLRRVMAAIGADLGSSAPDPSWTAWRRRCPTGPCSRTSQAH